MNMGNAVEGGEVFRILRMPDGNDVVIISAFDELDVDKRNRNVFRVDRDGKVIWQITRIEYPDTNWELKHRIAREEGQPGCIEPFIRFYVTYADGTTKTDPQTGMAPDVIDWVPGCKVELANLGFGTRWFTLDVDTGVAVDITTPGLKAW
jgi:hypothetical protein